MKHVLSNPEREMLIDKGWWIMGCPGFISVRDGERALWDEFRRIAGDETLGGES